MYNEPGYSSVGWSPAEGLAVLWTPSSVYLARPSHHILYGWLIPTNKAFAIPVGYFFIMSIIKCGMITFPFPNFNGAAVEVWELINNFITHFTCEYLSMLGLKLFRVSKKEPYNTKRNSEGQLFAVFFRYIPEKPEFCVHYNFAAYNACI